MNIKSISIGILYGLVLYTLLTLMFDFLGANSPIFMMLDKNFSNSSIYWILSFHDFVFIMLFFFACNYLVYKWLNKNLTTAITAQLVLAALAFLVNLAGSNYSGNAAYYSYIIFITLVMASGSLASFLVIKRMPESGVLIVP